LFRRPALRFRLPELRRAEAGSRKAEAGFKSLAPENLPEFPAQL
jgi:hypothetical protein